MEKMENKMQDILEMSHEERERKANELSEKLRLSMPNVRKRKNAK